VAGVSSSRESQYQDPTDQQFLNSRVGRRRSNGFLIPQRTIIEGLLIPALYAPNDIGLACIQRTALAAREPASVTRKDGQSVGIYFLALVVLFTFLYLFYALFRPERF